MDLMDYRRKIIMSSPHLSHAEGAVATFPDGTDLPLKSLLVNIDPVQSGTGDPSPTNIRPISGWSAVGVHDTGINLWDEEWENGLISISNGQNVNGTGIRSKNMCPCAPNTTYYVKFGSGGSKYIFWYDKSGTFISYANTTGSRTETSPANARFFRIRNDVSTTYNHDISINYPSTDHDYHAYTGTSVTISLGRTVYGGTLNVLTGELVAYPYYASYNGETLTGRWVSDRDKYVAGTTPTIGAQVVDMSGTGTTYTLTAQTVRSLVGQNNIFSDTGNIALDYWAHP